MKYQKIAIWRAFLLKRNVFSHLLRRTRPCTCQTHTHLHGRTSRDRPTHQRPSHTQTPNRTPHRGKNDSDSLRSSSARGGLPLSSAVRALKLAPLLGCAGVGRPCLFLRQHADAGLTSSRGGARMSTLFSCGPRLSCGGARRGHPLFSGGTCGGHPLLSSGKSGLGVAGLELVAAESSPSVAESRAEDTSPTATRAEAVLSSPAAVRGQAGIPLIGFHAPAHLLELLTGVAINAVGSGGLIRQR
jgi:hypothetical protein